MTSTYVLPSIVVLNIFEPCLSLLICFNSAGLIGLLNSFGNENHFETKHLRLMSVLDWYGAWYTKPSYRDGSFLVTRLFPQSPVEDCSPNLIPQKATVTFFNLVDRELWEQIQVLRSQASYKTDFENVF